MRLHKEKELFEQVALKRDFKKMLLLCTIKLLQ